MEVRLRRLRSVASRLEPTVSAHLVVWRVAPRCCRPVSPVSVGKCTLNPFFRGPARLSAGAGFHALAASVPGWDDQSGDKR